MDWSKIIQDIKNKGFNQLEISKFAGCSPGYISFLLAKKKNNPVWTIGDALIRMRDGRKKKRKLNS